MKPIGKFIIINKIVEQVTTDSGLILSDDEATTFRYKKAEVVKVGTEVSVISDGDIIYYDRNSGHTMIIDGVTYSVITERDVVVVDSPDGASAYTSDKPCQCK